MIDGGRRLFRRFFPVLSGPASRFPTHPHRRLMFAPQIVLKNDGTSSSKSSHFLTDFAGLVILRIDWLGSQHFGACCRNSGFYSHVFEGQGSLPFPFCRGSQRDLWALHILTGHFPCHGGSKLAYTQYSSTWVWDIIITHPTISDQHLSHQNESPKNRWSKLSKHLTDFFPITTSHHGPHGPCRWTAPQPNSMERTARRPRRSLRGLRCRGGALDGDGAGIFHGFCW